MISPKRLLAMAKKWQKAAASGRRTIVSSEVELAHVECFDDRTIADKGHFVVYSVDKKRFVVPLKYLDNNIIRELLRLSEEEFGLPGEGPITVPCDATFMDYIVSLVRRRRVPKDLENSLLTSMSTGRCFASSNSLPQRQRQQQQIPLHGF
ncbi:PREDICTED: auxin-responsive protein SAUR67-like [Nelumbo nucifera]|uniref:Auxin-responsive protein SAUR68-like n=2 Tax=Nelumbo nucifera TaxID=4432 RepID=A0A822ZFH1_NELNU|nr:PREDICTED: auxin-responsive protein SAUR67-like [Nelumbo nucifera]DAD41766.1 TPA_asm: hypothetical protein HUJ06_016089 [Nelumbo nucifera]